MRFSIALAAGFLVNAAADEATAATFTPDMWVYEVTLTPTAFFFYPILATTSLPVGSTTLPAGDCEVFVRPPADPLLFCEYLTPEEAKAKGNIDVFTEEILSPLFVRIGFNRTKVVIDGTDPFPQNGGYVEVDFRSYPEGRLLLDFYSQNFFGSYFDLSPSGSTGSHSQVVNR